MIALMNKAFLKKQQMLTMEKVEFYIGFDRLFDV